MPDNQEDIKQFLSDKELKSLAEILKVKQNISWSNHYQYQLNAVNSATQHWNTTSTDNNWSITTTSNYIQENSVNNKRINNYIGLFIYHPVNNDFNILLGFSKKEQAWTVLKDTFNKPENATSTESDRHITEKEVLQKHIEKTLGFVLDTNKLVFLMCTDFPKNRKNIFTYIYEWNGTLPEGKISGYEEIKFFSLDLAYQTINPNQKVLLKQFCSYKNNVNSTNSFTFQII